MGLYEVLKERRSINLLKSIYDREIIHRRSHTTKLSDIMENTPFEDVAPAIELLESHGMISHETVQGEHIVTKTEKGKNFAEAFDFMRRIFKDEIKKEEQVRISYELSEMEKKILCIIYIIKKETGKDLVPLKSLTRELFPYEDPHKKYSLVGKHLSKLEEINIVRKEKTGRVIAIRLNESGLRMIKEYGLDKLINPS